MKFVVILGILLITFQISYQNELAGKIIKTYFKSHEEVKKQCLDEINVDKTVETIFEESGVIENNEDIRCFAKCVLVKSGVVSESGDLLPEVIAKNVGFKDPKLAYGIQETCSGYDKVDFCKGAKQIFDCAFKYLESQIQ